MGGPRAGPGPTTMGWRGRGSYLDPPRRPYLFDSVGNAAPTVWVNGHIAGAWVQDEANRVQIRWREQVGRGMRRRAAEAVARLEAFVEGERIPMTYAAALADGKQLPLTGGHEFSDSADSSGSGP
ncbi:DNA glycosylase AlkZ-like family protein [Nostocoides australiense]|nr:hypothetical protein [Actinomycetota bacterium]